MTLRSQIIRLAKENKELRKPLLKILAKRYPTPADVAKAAQETAEALYKARGKMDSMVMMLQDAWEDSRGTGIGFSGATATKFSARLKKVKDTAYHELHELYMLSNDLEVLSRDLGRVRPEKTASTVEKTAATEIPVEEVPEPQMGLVELLRRKRHKPIQAFDGIHGFIVTFDPPDPSGFRLDKETLRKVIGNPSFRWLESHRDGSFSVGM